MKNTNNEIITVIDNWDDVRRGVNINLDDLVDFDNDLDVCGDFTDANILASKTNNALAFIRWISTIRI